MKDAALPLHEEARFRTVVREGIAQADRGEFIEEEMDARVEQMLRLIECGHAGRRRPRHQSEDLQWHLERPDVDAAISRVSSGSRLYAADSRIYA